jgi:hypothetical protein
VWNGNSISDRLISNLTKAVLHLDAPGIKLQNSTLIPCPVYSLFQPLFAVQSATTSTLAFRRLYPAPAISKVAPHERLSVISRHLDPRPAIPINTPYSIEQSFQTRRLSSSPENSKMASQPNHPALLIPGPIEFDDAVLQSMSHYRSANPTYTLLLPYYLSRT